MERVEHYPNGSFCWVDVGANDAARAKAFYGGLFGWASEDLPGPFPRPTFTIVADPQGAVFTAAAVPGGPARGVDGS
jgi:predicted enzyme related to lactoylglutathione lyase